MKIAVVGSREFKDKEFVQIKLKSVFENLLYVEDILLVSGGAKGVDSWAEELVQIMQIPKIIFKPDWNKYGKLAGYKRNKLIVDEADKVLAFWDGRSRGTKHSIDLAIEAGKPIDIYVRT